MVLAVLETRMGLQLSGCDIFLNIAGGIRINEPAADLAVAAALMSALKDVALPPETVFFGEIGLSGEVRAVAQADLRLKEAAKLGFKEAAIPALKKKLEKSGAGLKVHELEHVQALEDVFGASGTGRGGGVRRYGG
jgi:DNA repair protein RadA/Sms